MATVTITIPDPVLSRVMDGFAKATGWTAATGQTKGEWCKQHVIEYVKHTAAAGEAQQKAEDGLVLANGDFTLS